MAAHAEVTMLLEEAADRPERRTSKFGAIVVFVSVLAVFGLVAVANLSDTEVTASFNMNRDKVNFAILSGVEEKAAEVMDPEMGKNLRFAIFGFNKDRSAIIPLVEGAESNDWEADWTSFKNALPEADIAAAVYNFPYWVEDNAFKNEPILITWRPAKVDLRELARGGYFLGSIMLSTKGVDKKFALDSLTESYDEFCRDTMEVDPAFCNMEREFHNCPFGESSDDPEAMVSPCEATECDGAAFEDYKSAAPGSMPEECCHYITDFCDVYEDFPGCHPVSMINIELLCQIPGPDEVPTVFVDDSYVACEEECVNPCPLFDNPHETFQKCSACPVDMKKHAEFGDVIMQCHPEALGFALSRCCGADEQCTEDKSETECQTLEAFQCQFVDHNRCAPLAEEQKQAAAEAEAAEAARLAALEAGQDEEEEEEEE